MEQFDKDLLRPMVACCVFIHCGRFWEDYDNLELENEAINTLREWIISTYGPQEGISSSSIETIAKSTFVTLKTDWTIGRAQIASMVSLLSKPSKAIISRYIQEVIAPDKQDDLGILKAVETITTEL